MTEKQKKFADLILNGEKAENAFLDVYDRKISVDAAKGQSRKLLFNQNILEYFKKKRGFFNLTGIDEYGICDDVFCPKDIFFAEQKDIFISDIIAPSFYSLHRDIMEEKYTHFFLKGGRGSTKSSFISIEIILGMMTDENANAVILRKVGINLKDSVFEQLEWAIETLGAWEYWDFRKSPLELIFKPTGGRIIFRGADKPKKIKSTKFSKGYPKFIWFEEADEFFGMEEIRNINQSLLRGGKGFFVFYSYNPPKSIRNWVNSIGLEKRDDVFIHHSTYLDVNKNWLGEQFFLEAKYLEKTRNDEYRHEYLGEVVGSGGEVFRNLNIREISKEEIKAFDNIARGIDWGYAADPFHYTVNHFDRKRKRLFIFFEIQLTFLSNFKAFKMIREENKLNKMIVCDSAEPKSIAYFSEMGLLVCGAKKGPDSIDFGIKWLSDLDEIVIDPVRCPNTAREFLSYELQRDPFGNFMARFPDFNNHSIDATRYSREADMVRVRVR